MAGALIISDIAREYIRVMIEKARANPVKWDQIKHAAIAGHVTMMKLEDRAPGVERPPSQHIMLGTYRAAFSFEEQPAGLFRHLSVSNGDGTNLPHPAAVEMIAKEFGMRFPPGENGKLWLEEFDPGKTAVNLIELAEPALH